MPDYSKIKSTDEKIKKVEGAFKKFDIDIGDESNKIDTSSVGSFFSSMSNIQWGLKVKALDTVTFGLAGKIFSDDVLDKLKYLDPMYWLGELFGASEKKRTAEAIIKLIPDQIDDMMQYILYKRNNSSFNDWLTTRDGYLNLDSNDAIMKTVRKVQDEQFKKLVESAIKYDWFGLNDADAKDFWEWSQTYRRKVNVNWLSGGWHNLLNALFVYMFFDLGRNGSRRISIFQVLSDFVTGIKDGFDPISQKDIYEHDQKGNYKLASLDTNRKKAIILDEVFGDRNVFYVLDKSNMLSSKKENYILLKDVLEKDFNIKSSKEYIDFLDKNKFDKESIPIWVWILVCIFGFGLIFGIIYATSRKKSKE